MIKSLGVVGCGQMGSGIAQVAAEHGHAVVVRDVEQGLLDRALAAVRGRWARAVDRGALSPEAAARAAERLRASVALEDLRDCGVVIEAIPEDAAEKRKLFESLDRLCPPDTILATNTSALPVTELAMATGRPDRVCGMHFFNPVPAMKLVEVARTLFTSAATCATATELARSLGKEPVLVADRAGFVVNRLLVPYLLDAVRALEAGLASSADIDTAMRLGCGHPMGPLALLDLIGLDTACFVADILFEEFREPRYAPPPLLKAMVRARCYGKKTGRGFYDYSAAEPRPADLGLALRAEDPAGRG